LAFTITTLKIMLEVISFLFIMKIFTLIVHKTLNTPFVKS